jgi:hypothetical protein
MDVQGSSLLKGNVVGHGKNEECSKDQKEESLEL